MLPFPLLPRLTADANLIWARWDPFEKNHESERMQKAHEQLKRLTNHQLVNQVR